MKLILFTTIFVLCLVFLLPGVFSLRIKYLPVSDQPSLDRTEKIYGEKVLKQKFISSENNLTAIGLSIKNPNLLNKDDIDLTLFEGDIVVRSHKLNGANIEDGAFVKFIFDPLLDSKEKEYEFSLSASGAKDATALEPFISSNKPKNTGSLMIGEQEATGSSLSYVSFYKPEGKLLLMSEIYSAWFGRLTRDTAFFIIYLLILVGLLGCLVLINFPNFNFFIGKDFRK